MLSQDFFNQLLIAIQKKYTFNGDNIEKSFFIKLLLCLQMLKDYRMPLLPINTNLMQNTNLKNINTIIKSKKLTIDYSWAVWKRDKIMGKLAKTLWNSDINIIGTNIEFNEFVLRYLISIWLIDWEGPLYAILQATKQGTVDLPQLNKILSLWDFTKIFINYYEN